MDKKVVMIIVGIVLLVGGAVGYVYLKPADTGVDGATVSRTDDDPASMETPKEPVADGQPGVYTDYSEQAVLSTAGTKLLFFHAPWCPQCREMEASIQRDGVPSGVTVFKVDYDSNQGLRQKYGVTLQTTFVKVDDEGNKVASYVAYEEPQFSSVERELLR